MRHVIPPIFLLLYDIALQGFKFKGNHPIKRFHLLFFLFSQIKQRRNSNRLHILHYFWLENPKKEASHETLFFLFYSLNINVIST